MASLSDLINLNLNLSDEKIVAEYIWIGGSGMDLRSKARTLPSRVRYLSELPKWNYDGSSRGQTPGHDSEVILRPRAIFKDPFRGGDNILVMCDTYTPAGEPMPTNKRFSAENTFSHLDVAEVPWYSIEQEYTLLQKDVKWPLVWPAGGYPGPQGPYYCGIGADKAWGCDIADAHYKACLYAGINISGINAGVMPGQWEFQIGPSLGISAGDELWAARYILERITEIAGVVVSFDPKPIQGVANRGASIQVGSNMDRRPASNMDPYVETSMIARRMHAGTSIDQGIAYVLMLVALVLTYLPFCGHVLQLLNFTWNRQDDNEFEGGM